MITELTYYRWRKEYGGIRIDQAKKLKTLDEYKEQIPKVFGKAVNYYVEEQPKDKILKIFKAQRPGIRCLLH